MTPAPCSALPPLEAAASPEAAPSAEEAHARRLALGCATAETEAFIQSCEFISLGCYCALSEALLHLGLRRHAYPFDWVRSPMDGVIHCFETGFEDFLTYTEVKEAHDLTCFAQARWGGSFWHHDLEDEKVQCDFERRVDRILGNTEVPSWKPRVFVRLLNSTRELDLALKLKDVLQCVFPLAPIYLLLIVDLQEVKGPHRLAGADSDRLLVHFLDSETVYKNTSLETQVDYRTRTEAYAAVVAFAIRYWSGGAKEGLAVQAHPSLAHLAAACEQYFGGNPADELFSPQYFKGHRLAVKHRTAPTLPRLIHGRKAEFMLPEGTVPGGLVQVNIFGEDVTLRLPPNAAAGHMMRCRLVEGVLTAVMVIAASTAPAIAATAPAITASLPGELQKAGLLKNQA
uniref:Uncharacterized protein n=1 Tax=Alexandrium monilatum TaxID=311494 RepID=A0A7S4VTF1_9DINO